MRQSLPCRWFIGYRHFVTETPFLTCDCLERAALALAARVDYPDETDNERQSRSQSGDVQLEWRRLNPNPRLPSTRIVECLIKNLPPPPLR